MLSCYSVSSSSVCWMARQAGSPAGSRKADPGGAGGAAASPVVSLGGWVGRQARGQAPPPDPGHPDPRAHRGIRQIHAAAGLPADVTRARPCFRHLYPRRVNEVKAVVGVEDGRPSAAGGEDVHTQDLGRKHRYECEHSCDVIETRVMQDPAPCLACADLVVLHAFPSHVRTYHRPILRRGSRKSTRVRAGTRIQSRALL